MKTNTTDDSKSRPLVVGICAVAAIFLVAFFVVWVVGKRPAQITESKVTTHVGHVPQWPAATLGHSMGVTSSVTDTNKDKYPPETEAALAAFGLSATSVVPISVMAQAVPPVILPGHLGLEPVKKTNN